MTLCKIVLSFEQRSQFYNCMFML